MKLPLSLVKMHLRLAPADTSEDELLQVYIDGVEGEFLLESKRRWPVDGEPALVVVTDPDADPVVSEFVRYLDPAVLSEAEQQTAKSWQLLMVAHKYENRQPVVVSLNVTAVPETTKRLMNLLREPTV